MVYQQNIPGPTDLISDSQGDLQGNFQAIKAAFDINHVTFDASGQGKHKFVEMPNQGIAPAGNPSGAANEFTLFSQQTSVGNIQQLWYKRNNEASSYQLTSTNPNPITNGHSFLPGGLLIQWGQVVGAPSLTDPVTITYPTSFSAAPFSLQVTPVRDGTSARGIYIKNLGAQYTASSAVIRIEGTGINALLWIAIGPGPT